MMYTKADAGHNRSMNSIWRLAGATLMTAALAACGGGGGGSSSDVHTVQGPPTDAATITLDAAGAVDAVQAAVSGAQQVATAQASLFGTGLFFGDPSAAGGAGVRAAGGVHAQDSMSGSCYEVFGTMPCHGSVSVDASFSLDADDIPAGSSATIAFNGIRTVYDEVEIAIDGVMKLDFLSRLEGNPAAWTQESFIVDFDAFRGHIGSVSFGPLDLAARLDINGATGVTTTTINGIRFSGTAVSTTSGGTTVEGGNVRLAAPDQSARYVDVALDRWFLSSVDGQPISGSATITGDGSVGARVTLDYSQGDTLYYTAVLTGPGGVPAQYRVTATYVGSNVSYSAWLY